MSSQGAITIQCRTKDKGTSSLWWCFYFIDIERAALPVESLPFLTFTYHITNTLVAIYWLTCTTLFEKITYYVLINTNQRKSYDHWLTILSSLSSLCIRKKFSVLLRPAYQMGKMSFYKTYLFHIGNQEQTQPMLRWNCFKLLYASS